MSFLINQLAFATLKRNGWKCINWQKARVSPNAFIQSTDSSLFLVTQMKLSHSGYNLLQSRVGRLLFSPLWYLYFQVFFSSVASNGSRLSSRSHSRYKQIVLAQFQLILHHCHPIMLVLASFPAPAWLHLLAPTYIFPFPQLISSNSFTLLNLKV